ncbi:transglutaminase domain-containing protein [Flavobacterium eburneipallidum]|uniref:transglutaminase domain-containing protein n=1 Tax=Flavobacterium eburneipallidum TaxID=3003263 RepID=UPI0024829675|nr:DUF3857 domain-containing protein [Flavobacterium eburneipallidum]
MKINLLTIVLLFSFFSNSNAQDFRIGKVSMAELEEKEHPKDPTATAAILFKKGEVKFVYTESDGFQVVTEVKTRIKIYKKEGYDWANQEVRYYLDNNINENVFFSDAATYNLVNGKIEKTKLKSDGEFIEKINKFWGLKKITLPNIKEGAVIEFAYTIKTGIVSFLRDWDFQTSIPVNYSEFTTYIPEYYEYKSNQKGFVTIARTVEKSRGSIIINSKERTGGFGGPVKTEFSQDKIEFSETKTNYLVKDLPAMKDEAFVNNIDNYTSSISHELSLSNFPGTPIKYYSTDWASVVKTIYEYSDFGNELNKTGYFEEDITKLLNGLNTQNERVSTVFNYVKNNVKWNNLRGYSCDEGVKTAYKNKTGNTAEINLMLTAMLRFAGFNANPVLVSTRDNGITFFPSRTAFNGVIAAVETPEGMILLDATEKYSEPNVLPFRDLNWVGRLIRKDGTSTEVDLMPKALSREVTNMSLELKTDGTATGKIRNQFTNHEALKFRKANLGLTTESYLEKLETNNNDIEVSDYARENDLDLSQPMVETFAFKDTKDIEIIDGKIYVSPLLFLVTKENPFKQEVREYPVDFGYPKQEKYNININIPEGYVVESMPVGINIGTGENVGSFKYMIANSANSIQIVINKDINTAIVQADFYPVLKDFYKQIIDKQNEKIVLKKI